MTLTRGSGEDALSWIRNSELNSEQRAHLVAFVNRFPSMTFTKANFEFLDSMEFEHQVTIPNAVKKMFTALLLVDDFPEFRVDDYTYWTPRTDNMHPIWYASTWGYANEQERNSFLQANMFPVAQWADTGLSSLAINVSDGQDTKIYEFTGEDIVDDIQSNNSPDSSVFPAFTSYTELISHISELRFPDGTLIHAR
ncbi:hypothetical protein [Streptomyces sp. NBC_01022]|uniref:hypothetical protein n=1 Tax=Streptomyces sp. NBC_01022 TaxID=2903723 RepID=UPI002DDA203C|nr:hypothetical protein [Streptomyces sp. NBC_01022]WRZ79107.1 hypothetical protein OG316_01910 [Streptomyces sp. NBC_01022]WRZ86571.1 hypothetical protein OG316_42985 [Streptomyces sp. NBC_01022]